MKMHDHAAPTSATELWRVVRQGAEVDPRRLADAIVDALREGALDFRSQLLVRDSIEALRRHWGRERLEEWIAATRNVAAIREILSCDFEQVGFPSLEERLMESTDRATVLEFLRELSLHVRRPVKLYVGGSIALILADRLSRHGRYPRGR
jgi:hypothetical protein